MTDTITKQWFLEIYGFGSILDTVCHIIEVYDALHPSSGLPNPVLSFV